MIDLHVHPSFSMDAEGAIEQFCHTAVSLGLREIGFATHLDTDRTTGDAYVIVNGRRVESSSDAWLHDYEDAVRAVGDQFAGDLTVRLGVELDYFPGVEEELPDDFLDTPFDFIIGSVHLIDHKALSLNEQAQELFGRYTPKSLSDVYYGLLMQCIESGLCDIVGHIDIYRRFGEKRWGNQVHEMWKDHVTELANAIKRRNVSFEVNTSSWRKGMTEPMPESDLISALMSAGVHNITVGSDAHRPPDVGAGVNKAISMLMSLGVDTLTTFEKRRPLLMALHPDR